MKPSILIFILCSITHIVAQPGAVSANEETAVDKLGWKFEYDDGDRITKLTNPAGRTTNIQYSFDDTKRLRKLSRLLFDGSLTDHGFDEHGRLKSMKDSEGRVTYGYDKLNRLNHIQRNSTPAIIYTHDSLNRIKNFQIGNFYDIEYTYDFLGRLASMKTPAGVVQYEYLTGQGQMIRKLPNGIITITEYAPNGVLSQITHGLVKDATDTRYEVLAQYSYQYRADGLIEAIQERSGVGQFVKSYEYDTVGRVVHATGPRGQQRYEYDLVGNRVESLFNEKTDHTSTYDWAGRMTSFDGNLSNYDASGNLSSLKIHGKNVTFRYDPNDQLAEIPSSKIAYRYDGNGKLLTRTKDGNKTTFITDPLSDYWRPLVMEDQSNHRTLVVWDGETPLMMIRDGKPEYLLHDHLGSVRLGIDVKGKVTKRIDYDPFGQIEGVRNTGQFAPRFAGLFWEPEGEIYLTRARAYSPELGRFLQVDPLQQIPSGSQKGFSGYSCCGGDMVNFADLDGVEYIEPIASHVIIPELWNHLYSRPYDLVKFGLKKFKVPILDAALYFKSAAGVIASADGLVDYSQRHYGDPSMVAKNMSFSLKVFRLITPKLIPPGLTNLIDSGVEVGNAIRSRFLQNRAISLISLPLGERFQFSFNQELNVDWGHYTVSNSDQRFFGVGGWSLQRFNGRSSSSYWGRYNLKDYRLHTGARLSRSVYAFENRIEDKNYKEKVRERHTSSREVFNGAAISKAVDEWNRTGVYDPTKWEYILEGSHGKEARAKKSLTSETTSTVFDVANIRKKKS